MASSKNISVESSHLFHHGFILSEQELRRINDIITDQMNKIGTDFVFSYTVKFENGVVAKYESLDDVVILENSGSGLLVRLEIECMMDKKDNYHKIIIIFRKIDSSNESESIPIKYDIFGKSRDWVFVTSSLIDERIQKIKRQSFSFFKKNSNTRLLTSLILPITLLIGTLIPMVSIQNKKHECIKELKKLWLEGKIKDPIDFFISLEERKNQYDSPFSMFYYMGITIAIIVFFGIIFYVYDRLYPKYNFCWGDYLSNFEKNESRRKTFNIVVITGLVISVAGSIIATKILNVF